MFASPLHVEQLALASTDDLIGWFNLIQQGFYFSERFAARTGQVSWIRSDDAPGGGKFIRKLTRKKRVVCAGLGNDFLIRLNRVQGSEPTLKCQTPSKAQLIQARYRLG